MNRCFLRKTCQLLIFAGALARLAPASPYDFNFGWRFAPGEHPDAAAVAFDDSEWEAVDLPHDWAIAGPFGAPTEQGHTGKLPWQGEGWYRKTFHLSEADKGKRLQFIFDGVMASPKVYLNGQAVGGWIYGYNSFHLDATEAARFGGDNVLAVHADTRRHHSRWYPGAGIYRKVSMRLVDPVHIPLWGVFVTTPDVSADQATVQVAVEVANTMAQGQDVELQSTILDPDGQAVAEVQTTLTIPAGKTATAKSLASIPQPKRWDVDHPHLYSVVSRVVSKGQERDRQTTSFGIRTFQWTADDGFHLNGRRLQLYGVNNHHDHGMLGAALFPRALERQLQIMKDMGVNAIRTSHNAPAPELLELCDRMGLVVWNELFDKYGPTAGVECGIDEFVDTYAEREVINFVRRDRNHPCVIIWSIGNEIGNLRKRHVDQMVAYFKKQDPTRPTTLGSHIPAQAQEVITALDASGWNYAQKYMTARHLHPDKALIYSESGSAFGTRGAYKHSLPANKTDWGRDGELNGHVLTSASWSDIPEHEFDRMIKHPFVAGEFVWTGFDYLGEPTPYSGNYARADGRLARSSYFGIVDLAGLPKDSYYLYRSHWRPDTPTVFLAPHWNWKGLEGERLPVFVYTNGDEAELFLNGKSLGRRAKSKGDAIQTDNLAFGRVASASSEEHKQDAGGNVQEENLAGKAVDGNDATRWCAADGTFPQRWQVDLEAARPLAKVGILWEKVANDYQFKLLLSPDGQNWTTVDAAPDNNGGQSMLIFPQRAARYLRIDVTGAADGSWASIREVNVFEDPDAAIVNPYFNIMDAYRIRWPGVPYAPGELKAVAWKAGKRIGEAVVRTAGAPARLALTADRSQLKADGMDLCYVTIEMQDKDGTLCPLAMDRMTFAVEGAGRLMGVGNGNQMELDAFTDETHRLFYGKAVAVVRNIPGKSGPATLNVSTAQGIQAILTVDFR